MSAHLLPANWPDMHARDIVAALGGHWYGSYGLCFCPAHDDGTEPALSIRQGAHTVLLKCHAGCTGRAVARALYRLADSSITPMPGRPHESAGQRDVSAIQRLIEKLWMQSIAVQGTRAELYLRSRGIRWVIPPSLRYLPRTKHGPTGLWLPAILAPIRDRNRHLIALHRTFLDTERIAKTLIEPQRKLLGYPMDGAIELMPAGPVLGIAEGIEKGLAAMEIHRCPVWSAASASRLAGLRLPAGVRHLRIFADRNRPGLKAARKAVLAYANPGRCISIEPPPPPADDWDAWLREQLAADRRLAG